MPDSPQLLALLKQYFGYASFRPLQEDIIRDALAGKDVLALLPTGGGKSLCFQLPALARDGLTVVVSPLIALMKDQVDALQASGVPATFLNSSLKADESRARLRGLHNGEFRLLYAAPERLMLSGMLDDLQRWRVNLFAIDEAHCISEWGHDFRPEYRQIAQLRDRFPQVPFMALTATATERVREDIATQLKLRDPAPYVASFNRPNLTYRVSAKAGSYAQVLDFLRARPRDSGIIYCQARKTAESLAEKLRADGIKAAPYHAEVPKEERSANQEGFLRDEIRVICATIAFGMGINKPNVRFVIHYDLPKNIEGYYQETGRAGRDGLPSECVLLFSAGDVQKYLGFISEKPPAEQVIAREQLSQMVHYAECSGCRRVELLAYFSEESAEENCGACDNCLTPRATFDGTVAAQKFMSCVFRIRQAGTFGVGLNHVIEVLTGAQSERVLKWGHDKLTTYDIGREHTRSEWAAIGRELIRLGHLRQTTDKFPVVELTEAGMAALKARTKITLTKPVAAPDKVVSHVGEITCDELLFDKLRRLRKELADARAVPSYIIFSDVALRQMARLYPQTEGEFSRISGVGASKLRDFGAQFLEEIAAHLRANPRQIFADTSFTQKPAAPQRSKLTETVVATLHYWRGGRTVEEIAQLRDVKPTTIYGHLADAVEAGEAVDLNSVMTADQQTRAAKAFYQFGWGNLTGVKESLPDIDYGPLRLFRALKNREGR
ncbi:MAG: DNA helicase RecQ [Pedosphaera sp. Tous-C6FEB]|nr:MAG: DNA helicase RecQ [Pedosphaera sp. Tous-C6FEB]